MNINKTLEDRAKTHGEYTKVAKLNIELLECFKINSANSWEVDYIEAQMVALNMIFHKLSRIGCGNPDEIDHWRDIAGYATLVVKELETSSPELE